MKYIITSTLAFLLTVNTFAQTKAVTDKGEEVLLLDNGTWRYASITPGYETSLDTLHKTKSEKATFSLKGDKVKYAIWLDPKKWSFKKSKEDDDHEYMLTLKGEDAYCMVLPERIPIPINTLQEIAINNFREKDPNAAIIREDIRMVNGLIVKMMAVNVTTNGLKLSYIGYYYSDDSKTIQLIAFTGQNLLDSYRKEMEDLLNGFVVLD